MKLTITLDKIIPPSNNILVLTAPNSDSSVLLRDRIRLIPARVFRHYYASRRDILAYGGLRSCTQDPRLNPVYTSINFGSKAAGGVGASDVVSLHKYPHTRVMPEHAAEFRLFFSQCLLIF
jgi:hypothetical protein